METVFDHNITEEERKVIGVNDALINMSQMTNHLKLAYLYHYREDQEKYEHYASLLEPEMQLDFYRTINHP